MVKFKQVHELDLGEKYQIQPRKISSCSNCMYLTLTDTNVLLVNRLSGAKEALCYLTLL